jgi:transposase
MEPQKMYFVGVDTHKLSHTAAIIDQTFDSFGIVETAALPKHYPAFTKKIQKIASEGKIIFGLEDTSGFGASLYRFLNNGGFDIREINPVKTKRERMHKVHPDKSDPDDALDIAKVLAQEWRTLPAFKRDQNVEALQKLVRQRDDFVCQLITAKNHLHAALHLIYPGYQQFFPEVFEKGALAFWEKFPTPSHLKNIGQQRLAQFLTTWYTYKEADTISTKMLGFIDSKAYPQQLAHAYESIIPMLVSDIRGIQEKIDLLEMPIEQVLLQLPYLLHTIQGVGIVSAAQLVSQIAPPERFSSADKLARFAGIAPAKYGSANYVRFHRSRAGRRSLNKTFYLIALSQIATNRNGKPRCPAARKYYLRKVKEGKSKKHAMKCLQRRLVDIVYAMMKSGAMYDPNMSKNKNLRDH